MLANAKLVTIFAVCKSDQMMFDFLVKLPPNSTNVFVSTFSTKHCLRSNLFQQQRYTNFLFLFLILFLSYLLYKRVTFNSDYNQLCFHSALLWICEYILTLTTISHTRQIFPWIRNRCNIVLHVPSHDPEFFLNICTIFEKIPEENVFSGLDAGVTIFCF